MVRVVIDQPLLDEVAAAVEAQRPKGPRLAEVVELIVRMALEANGATVQFERADRLQ